MKRLLPLCRSKRQHLRKVNQPIVYFLCRSPTSLPLFVNSIRNEKEAGGNMLQANASANSLKVIPRTTQISYGSPLNPVWSSVVACRLLLCPFFTIHPCSFLLWHFSSVFCSILCLPLSVCPRSGSGASQGQLQLKPGHYCFKSKLPGLLINELQCLVLKSFLGQRRSLLHQVPWQSKLAIRYSSASLLQVCSRLHGS